MNTTTGQPKKGSRQKVDEWFGHWHHGEEIAWINERSSIATLEGYLRAMEGHAGGKRTRFGDIKRDVAIEAAKRRIAELEVPQ